jgi:hypothetical protein
MTIAEAYANIGKRVYIVIGVPDSKYNMPLYAGDIGIIATGAGEIGFAPDRYEGLLQYAHEGTPFVEYCVLASKQTGDGLPQQLELFGDVA